MTVLQTSLRDENVLAGLRERWRERGSLRIEPFLDEASAEALAAALDREPFTYRSSSWPALPLQYWQLTFIPEEACDHVLCRFGRFVHGELLEWASSLSGLALAPPEDRQLSATRFAKGSFLDPHNDTDKKRVLAYVVGLTRERWDPSLGGHLEFLGGPGNRQVVERRQPGWNTLDLFDVRCPERPHRVSLLRGHFDRVAVSGWFYLPPPALEAAHAGGS